MTATVEVPNAPDLVKALGVGVLRLGEAIIKFGAVIGVLGGGAWYLLGPHAQEFGRVFFDELSQPMLQAIENNTRTNAMIVDQLSRVDRRPLLQFNGSPVLLPPFVTSPGDVMSIGYSLRRTDDCPTNIEVNFISGTLQRVNTSLSYVVEAVRSRVSPEYGFFVVDVRIPKDTPPGWYSYSPRAVPLNCPGYDAVIVPPSPFFEVR